MTWESDTMIFFINWHAHSRMIVYAAIYMHLIDEPCDGAFAQLPGIYLCPFSAASHQLYVPVVHSAPLSQEFDSSP